MRLCPLLRHRFPIPPKGLKPQTVPNGEPYTFPASFPYNEHLLTIASGLYLSRDILKLETRKLKNFSVPEMAKDSHLTRGAYVSCVGPRVLRPNEARNIFRTGYKPVKLEERVLEVMPNIVNGRKYNHLRCVFLIGTGTKYATLPLGSVKAGRVASIGREPDRDPLDILENDFSGQSAQRPPSPSTRAAPMSHDHQADDVHNTKHSPTARSTPPLAPPSIGQIEISTTGDSSESETYVAHNQKWKFGASGESLNGDVEKISWSVLCPDGTVIKQGIAPEHMKP